MINLKFTIKLFERHTKNNELNFLGQVSMLDVEFVSGIKEFLPYVCNDSTDDSDKCPTIKMDPMKERMTVFDFIDEVS